MELETAKRLRDASAACGEPIDMCAGRSRDDMYDDRMFQLASRKLIEIVGEALRQAEISDPKLVDSISDLRAIVNTRNRIVHGYNSINYSLLWDIIQIEMPPLKLLLDNLLREAPNFDDPMDI